MMKHLIGICCLLQSLLLIGQEVEHPHSIHHAFIENKGQWDTAVLFKSHFQGGNLWVQQGKLVFHLQDYSAYQNAHGNFNVKESGADRFRQTVIHLNFAGCNLISSITKSTPSEAYYNYFLGNDRSKWASDVRGYAEATLHNLYDGIDLKLIEEQEQLKYEFHVAPQTDPKLIQLDYAGHQKLRIDREGNLWIDSELGSIRENKPYAYQILNGKVKTIACDFEISGKTVRFKMGSYDASAPLIIDPVLVFATYCGSVTDNFGMTATYGYDATAYSAGTIYGNGYPTPDNFTYDINSNFTVTNIGDPVTTDVFVSRYSANGTTMLWTTFLGGGNNTHGTETVNSLICDKQNNIYVYGVTSSTDFPTENAFQSAHAGGTSLAVINNGVNFGTTGTDIYVSNISANGHFLLGSTYIGGALNDGVNFNVSSGNYSAPSDYDSLTSNYGDQFRGEIMLDSLNNVLVASCTRSTDFPVAHAMQPANAGMQDGVIFKLSNNLSNLLFSTYIGGSKNDACYSVKIDSSYHIVFAGGTSSTNLPGTAGAWQSTYNNGKSDGFVGKLDATDTVLQRISYVGTANYDQAFFVEIDRNDNVFLLGQSAGGQFPVVNSGFSNAHSSQFIAKLNPDLTALQNSTVFGNGSLMTNISPSAFLVDICGNIYVSGWGANILLDSLLNGLSVSSNAFQSTPPNGFDFYLMVLERSFGGLLYGSYIGGNQAREHVDGGTSRFDKNGVVYQSVCGGCGHHSDFPTSQGAWSSQNLSPNCNNLIFKFDFELIPKAEFTADQTIGCSVFEVTLDNTSSASDSYLWDFGNGDTTSMIFNPTVSYANPGVYDIYLYVTDSICLLTDTAHIVITVTDSLLVDAGDPIALCTPVEITLTGNSSGTGTQFIWSSSPAFTDTLNTSLSDSTLTLTPQGSGFYYFQVSNAGCSKIDSIEVEFTSSSLVLTGNDSICRDVITLLTAINQNPAITFGFVWSPADIIVGPSTNNTVVVDPQETQYIYVLASASNGCLIKDSILIHVSHIDPLSVQAFASKNFVSQGSTVVLSAQPSGYSYHWTPESGLSSPNSQQTNALVEQTTVYTVEITDGICKRSDTVEVKSFEYVCGDRFVFVPSAFSPNKDGENDVLYVRSALVETMLFRVFDRWGELVFESTKPELGWDGTFKGKALDPDVYDYYLKAVCFDGQESLIKGNVTLLR
jgi:gliding motility-associated-like protein